MGDGDESGASSTTTNRRPTQHLGELEELALRNPSLLELSETVSHSTPFPSMKKKRMFDAKEAPLLSTCLLLAAVVCHLFHNFGTVDSRSIALVVRP